MDSDDKFLKVWELIWQVQSNLTDNKSSLKNVAVKKTCSNIPTDYRVVFGITGLIIMAINLPVVVSSGLILRKGQLSKNTLLLLGNISLSDMTLGLMVGFSQFFHYFNIGSRIRCHISICVIITCIVSSVCCVNLIAIDRYLYIVHGMKYKTWVLPYRVRRAIIVSWFWGLLNGVLTALNSNNKSDECFDCLYLKMTSTKIILFSTSSEVPFALIPIVLYARILQHTMKRTRDLKKMDLGQNIMNNNIRAFRGGRSISVSLSSTEEDLTVDSTKEGKSVFYISSKNSNKSISYREKKSSNTQKRAAKIIFFTAGGFLFTWLPYYILTLIYLSCDYELDREKCQTLLYISYYPLTIVGLLNYLLNPVIYAWWNKGFRKSVKKVWTDIISGCNKFIDFK